MACEQTTWNDALNASSACIRPTVTHCSDCHIGLCDCHMVECETCEALICSDCLPGHMRKHKREEEKNKEVAVSRSGQQDDLKCSTRSRLDDGDTGCHAYVGSGNL